jgi:hypothetical protein
MGKLETSDGARLANDTKKVAAPQGESGFGGDFKAPAREKKNLFLRRFRRANAFFSAFDSV